MRMGLASRIALMTATAVVLAALGASVVGFVQTDRQVNSDIDRFLEERTEEIIDGLRDQPRRNEDDDEDDRRGGRGNTTATDDDAEVQAIDETGAIIAGAGVVLPVDDADLKLAANDGPTLIRTVMVDDMSYRIATSHIDGGAIQVARSLESTNTLLASIRSQVLQIGLGVAVVAGLLGWLFARRAMRPLATLTRSVEQVAETQDLSTRVGSDGHDEVGRLSRGFDDMMDALSKSRDQQHRLVQDAAHELRTPLTSVNANVELLARAKDLDDDTRIEIIDGVRSELRQLNTLFTEIIELATDEHDRASHRDVDLLAIVESAAERQRSRSSNPIQVTGSTSPVVGDPVALERVVANLLNNAVKYSPEGSPITVTVDNGTVAVADQGPGIPEASREKVFERFYRSDTARAEPGSGLGLAIVAKIVADHGGTTFVREAKGGGAIVGFSVPSGA